MRRKNRRPARSQRIRRTKKLKRKRLYADLSRVTRTQAGKEFRASVIEIIAYQRGITVRRYSYVGGTASNAIRFCQQPHRIQVSVLYRTQDGDLVETCECLLGDALNQIQWR